MEEQPKQKSGSNSTDYWRANLRILGVLLSIWFIAGCVLSIFFVEKLNETKLGGFPLGFWFAQQGTIYVFILVILVYAFMMERLDRKHGVKEDK